jgi:hypothetical protein
MTTRMHHPRSALPFLFCLLAAAAVRAQAATELYIPIGRSPGASGRLTTIGTCSAIAARDGVVTVRTEDRTWTARVTAATRIFLDRSRLGLPNLYGTFDDLRGDLLMEVKYSGSRATGGACEWIKVQVVAARRQ